MKKNISMISLLSGFAILLAGAFILSSCEGPAGPPGLDGTDGTDGTDGINGIDANASCTICHSDDQVIVTRSRQYANSGHSTGDVAGYTNRTFGPLYNCAGCHTSQGFLDNLVGASNTPYANVTQPNCYTCHNIHDTYTEADWGLTSGDLIEPATGSLGVDMGTGNQCLSCHQMVASSLVVDSLWANFDAGTTTVTITSSMSRTGVHHAPQYNLLAGMDLFEFSGSTTYPTNHHVLGKVENGCVTCHMNDGFGDLTGHSMAMTWEFHGSETYNWPASCLECHSDGGMAADLDVIVEEVMVETDGLLAELYTLLVDAGIMYPSDAGGSAYLMKPGVFSTALTAAHVNYMAISEDRSHGFHNPAYMAAVLENTIEALSAK